MAKTKTAKKAKKPARGPAPSSAKTAAEFAVLKAKAKDTAVPGSSEMDLAALRDATDDDNLVEIHSDVIRLGYWQGARFDIDGNALVHKSVVDRFVGRKTCVEV